MLVSTLLALSLASSPTGAVLPRGVFDSVVPRLPGGSGYGRVCIRVHTLAMPNGAGTEWSDLVARTGVAITETCGIRVEVVVPADLRIESVQARVLDGLVLEPQPRSLFGRMGDAVMTLLRLLLVGRLVSAADDLAISGVVWAAALGAPDAEDEWVRLSTTERLRFERGRPTFSDHGDFVVGRAVLGLSAWTELLDLELRCTDRVTGREVLFAVPRLALHDHGRPPAPESVERRWASAGLGALEMAVSVSR